MTIAGVSFLLTSFSQSFLHVTLGYFSLTVGISLITIGMNTIIPLLKVVYLGLLMNLLHFFYGVGSTLTQRVTGYLLFHGFDWRRLFVVYFIMYIVSFLIYLFVTEPKTECAANNLDKDSKVNKYLLTLFCFAVGFYITAEIQTANWLLNYLKEAYHFNSDNGSLYVALFFGIFSVGRLFGGFVVEKVGYLKSVLISLILALILYSSGLILGEKWIILISMSGLFFAIGFPTLIIIVHNTFISNGTHTVGIVTTSGSIVSMVIGYLIGVFNDIYGVTVSMYLIPTSLLISIIMIILIARETKKIENA
jgi:fucose permease